jgi:polyphosphate:AMP phosphotransferase
MFDSADHDHVASKAMYKREEPRLREALLAAQMTLREKSERRVLIVIGGVDGAGKGETVNLLNTWLDPRHVKTHAFAEPTDEERERPAMWRYWRALPPLGTVGIFFGSWYTEPILERALGGWSEHDLDAALTRIRRHEAMLVAERTIVLKFWLHLSKDQQRKRLKSLERDPVTRWRVTPEEWKRFKRYDELRAVSTRAVVATSTADAPWIVVPGYDERYRSLTVGRLLLDALTRRELPRKRAPASRSLAPAPLPELESRKLLRDLDLTQKVPKARYEKQLEKLQGDLALLARSKKFRKRALIAVFEGMDAAGKGSAIRRVSSALDARYCAIIPIAAPSEEERAQPYLWRFWRQLPRRGRVTIFDRSWYGRVLVERVEGFCAQREWLRAYAEINEFEAELSESGIILAKFWLQVSLKEQLARFRARQKTPFKRFKITAEDWRNRKKWDAYEEAVCDMVDRTSSDCAPWTLVEANDKPFARLKILRTLVERLEEAL